MLLASGDVFVILGRQEALPELCIAPSRANVTYRGAHRVNAKIAAA